MSVRSWFPRQDLERAFEPATVAFFAKLAEFMQTQADVATAQTDLTALTAAEAADAAAIAALQENDPSLFVAPRGATAALAESLETGRNFTWTGDVTGGPTTFDGAFDVTTALTLATVNANVGTWGDATHVPQFTTNAKGLITGVSSVPITATGTVTSVALTAPSILSVAGSPVTAAGTLALSLATQGANLVFAGPTSGGAATPTFRALVAADIPTTVLGFVLNTGATGTNVGPELIAPRAGAFTTCKVVTKASDGVTALTFRIKQNGVDIFSVDPTVAAGTAGGTVSTFTTLTSSPLAVAAHDVFTLDVTSGSSSWQATIQLE